MHSERRRCPVRSTPPPQSFHLIGILVVPQPLDARLFVEGVAESGYLVSGSMHGFVPEAMDFALAVAELGYDDVFGMLGEHKI